MSTRAKIICFMIMAVSQLAGGFHLGGAGGVALIALAMLTGMQAQEFRDRLSRQRHPTRIQDERRG